MGPSLARIVSEWCFWAVALVLAVTYIARYDAFPLVGEETRVARVAAEMMDRNDYVVPRELGEPFNSRPPIIFWLIALASPAEGQPDLFAIRSASLFAVTMTGLMIYAFARTWMSPTGAMLAALFWASFPELLIANRKAEAEALFTFAVSASLFSWHYLRSRGCSPGVYWPVGYALAAIATLIKGPQAPICFVATTWLFAASVRDWRSLRHWGNFAGMAVYAGIMALWIVPYIQAEGIAGCMKMWSNDSVNRFRDVSVTKALLHLVVFPAEVLGCMMPWSLFLFAWLHPNVRRSADSPQGHRKFLWLTALVGFLPCWIAPTAMTRYYQPQYPALAILMAWPVVTFANTINPGTWRNYWRFLAVIPVAICVALAVIAGTSRPSESGFSVVFAWKQPVVVIAGLAVLALFACAAAWRTATEWRTVGTAVLGLATFGGLLAATAWTDAIRSRCVPVAEEISRLKETLPPGEPAAHVGEVHHRFVYFNGMTLRRLDPSEIANLLPGQCYCVRSWHGLEVSLPAGFKVVAEISMNRNRDKPIYETVVVIQRQSR